MAGKFFSLTSFTGQRSLPEAMKAAKAAKEAKEKFDKLKQEKDRKVELAFQTTKLEEKNLMKRGTEMEDKHKMEFEKLAGDTEVGYFLFFLPLDSLINQSLFILLLFLIIGRKKEN